MSEPDREMMRDFYDELGDSEWSRLEDSARGRVSYQVHRQLLDRFVEPEWRILEIGAGPGRFTMELARLGARVLVTDYSPVQLELNRARVGTSGAASAVEAWQLLDVCDTSRFADGEFDAVVAYGGPLSYAFEGVDEALAGLFRITRTGGIVLASVMSTLGSWRYHFAGVVDDTERAGEDANDKVFETGDLRYFGTRHICRMFRSREIAELVSRNGGTVVAMSASNWSSLADPEVLKRLEHNPDRWSRFLAQEVAACGEPGALDGGTHIIFAAAPGGGS